MYRIWSTEQVPILYIEIPLNELWFPIFLSTGAEEHKYVSLVKSENQIARMYSGTVFIVVVDVIETKCSLNLWKFPFDTQSCQMLFQLERFFQGSNGMDVVLAKSPQAYRFDSYPDDEWDLFVTKHICEAIQL